MKLFNIITLGVTLLAGGVQSQAQEIDYKGDELFKSRCYERATAQYMKVFHSNPSNKANPKFLRRLTESILKSEMLQDTARYYADLYLQIVQRDAEAHYMSALAHYHAHDFKIARMQVDSFQVYDPSDEANARAARLRSWINNAERMLKDTLQNPILNMGGNINSPSNELNPYVINDDNTIVFSCDDKFDRDAIINVYNIKAADRSGLAWNPSKKVTGDVNTPYDEYPSGPKANGMFFCSNKPGDFALLEAEYAGNGRFTDVVRFADPIDLRGSEVAGCLSETGDTLYFSGTLLNGKLGIFYSIRTMKGQWMEARLIPGKVNTNDSDENYPYLTNGGKRLYFASDREGTMGGYDLFYSDFDEKTQEWGEPVQLPYPINDTYDNMTISFTQNGRYAYVSLFREDSYGGRDIYAVLYDRIVPSSAIMRYTLNTIDKSTNKKVALQHQPVIEIRDKSGELVALERISMRNSSFIVVLDPGKYEMSIEADGCKPYTVDIDIAEMNYSTVPIAKTITLQPE